MYVCSSSTFFVSIFFTSILILPFTILKCLLYINSGKSNIFVTKKMLPESYIVQSLKKVSKHQTILGSVPKQIANLINRNLFNFERLNYNLVDIERKLSF